MVIEQAGKATGNVISSTGQAFSNATEGIPWWGKLALIGGGVGIAGYLAYYTINQLTGPSGGSCTTPGSPCYNALQPYQQAFQICANEYAKNLQQYINEDNANGTGFTSAQLNVLNQLEACMNQNASQISKIAKQYEPENPLDVAVTIIAAAVGAAIVLYISGRTAIYIYKSLNNNKPVSGSGAANAMKQTAIRSNYEDGNISPDQAAALKDQLPETTQDDIQANDDYLAGLQEDDVITQEEENILSDEDETNMEMDTEDTIDDYLGE